MRGSLCLMVMAFLTLLGAGGCRKPVTVPAELVGVWETSDPRYAGHPFEIRKDTLVFEHGGGYLDFAAYAIEKVESLKKDGAWLYTITYIIPEGLEYKFSFYYTKADGGVICFKNQRRIAWRRRKKVAPED